MIDPLDIVKARSAGQTRFAILWPSQPSLASALAGFGLNSDPARLTEIDAQTAHAHLKSGLWKDAAYNTENMPESQAEAYASHIIATYGAAARFFANHNPDIAGSWYPMTSATFDSGVIIARPDDVYVCIWFEDED